MIRNKDIIIDSMRHVSSERNILPANPYAFPSSLKMNINEISKDEFIDELESNCYYGFVLDGEMQKILTGVLIVVAYRLMTKIHITTFRIKIKKK